MYIHAYINEVSGPCRSQPVSEILSIQVTKETGTSILYTAVQLIFKYSDLVDVSSSYMDYVCIIEICFIY